MSMILVPNREAIQRLERARAQQEKTEAATEGGAEAVQQTGSDAPPVGKHAEQAETGGEAPPAGES